MRSTPERRALNKLSHRGVVTLNQPGRHSDGGGLYLVVDPSGARRWVYLFRWKAAGAVGSGRLREMGLGGFPAIDLKAARLKAAAARTLVAERIDPIAAKRMPHVPTFGDLADEVVETRSAELRNDKSKARWKRALEQYAAALRSMRVDAIETEHILGVLKPIWGEKPESAQKARGYIEAVLDAAKAKGCRSGENPARWRGHLDQLLPRRQKLTRGHHAALPYADVPEFLIDLRTRDSMSAWALGFLILTAARSGEVLGCRWEEIDLAAQVWTLPANRMKAGRGHRVPLQPAAIELLQKAAATRGDCEYVFLAPKGDQPLSSMSLAMLLRRMKRDAITVHGFRSSFRDWAGEETHFPRELIEAALAHTVGNDTERAYRRGDALEKRRVLMAAWEKFCATTRPESAAMRRATVEDQTEASAR